MFMSINAKSLIILVNPSLQAIKNSLEIKHQEQLTTFVDITANEMFTIERVQKTINKMISFIKKSERNSYRITRVEPGASELKANS